MNIVLLSGGSGKRLWPLSNHTRSKQFLQLLKKNEDEYESMMQRIYRQIHQVEGKHTVIIAANQTQIDSITNQLPREIEFVMEPKRRNTFPAVLLSAAYLAFEKKVSLEEPILVLRVDPYVEESYFRALTIMEQVVAENRAQLVLMGVSPTYPSEKYGYIQCREGEKYTNGELVYEVSSCYSKPDVETAKSYLKSGAYWNGGVFACKLGFIMEHLETQLQVTSYDDVVKSYERIESISFEQKMLEETKSIAMVPYVDNWKSLGTWNTLTEEMEQNTIGEVITDDTTENTHIINELSIPMLVLGAKNLIVAASPDGILISDKATSSYMKPYVDQLDNRPMFEQRRWGEYKVLDYVTYEDGMKSLTKHLQMNPGEMISYQSHSQRTEIWTIVDGEGVLVLDDKESAVTRGTVIQIKKEMKHGLKAITNLHFIEVQIGEDLIEEDIRRYEYKWDL